MRKKRKVKDAARGAIVFFLSIAITITAALAIYEKVREVFGSEKGVVTIVMLAVCFALSVFCAATDFFRHKIFVDNPTNEILDATERMASGNFKVRLSPRHEYDKYDEFDMIMDNFNRMADELSRNAMLKTDFISNVSHEIKTPLAIIQNYATALNNDDLTDEERKSYAETIRSAAERLTTLVSNVLKLNKLENQRLVLETEPTRIDECVAETVFAFEDLLEKKGVELVCDFDEVTVSTNASCLELVWNNLMSNAIKFTPSGGKITICVKGAPDGAIVKFSDTGIGMTEETGRRIFDKFYQGDASRSKDGNGLGLALVKKAIDAVGGEIRVESQLGKGSTFSVKIKGAVDEKKA